MMYPIMLADEQALLTGSALAFLIVGGVMFSVRSEDWDAVARALRRPPRPGPEPQPAGS
jgi:inner membrane protein involved in colicin E2 resistance